jgi:hypothetical protein
MSIHHEVRCSLFAGRASLTVSARRSEETTMKRYFPSLQRQAGKLGYILLWALGVPIPVLFIIYLLRGCT